MPPLSGTRILDLTRLLPGAACTLMLADLGAEVIKIEAPDGGDYARYAPPLINGESALFRLNNRNKRSLILDLKHPQGVEVLRRLVAGADVLVEGNRPGVMTRLGCDYTALRAVNPRLVYCSISGWGADGPDATLPGHDLNYMSRAGLLGAMPTPQVPGGQFADLGGAYAAVAGILAALLGRVTSGEGSYIDISLFESALPFAQITWPEAVATPQPSTGMLTGRLACYQVYRAADGESVALAALEPQFWAAFCAAVDRPDLLPDYLDDARQPDLLAELTDLFRQKTAAEWAALLEAAGCCFTRVARFPALVHDPQVQARGMLGIDADGQPWMRSPIQFNQEPVNRAAAPGYGEHTRAVLEEAGYSPDAIDQLIAAGVVRQGV
jgi:crotonobetainyl-CoA:carnitine CoA-transferase CaiB-like acyl-CoA transferase